MFDLAASCSYISHVDAELKTDYYYITHYPTRDLQRGLL